MSEVRRRRLPLWGWWLVVGGIHALMFGPIAWRALYTNGPEFVGPNLFRAHTKFSTFVFDDWWRPATPGYLWQVSARTATEALRSTDPRVGAVIATTCFYALFGVAIFEVYRRVVDRRVTALAPWIAAAASVGIALLESPAALVGWTEFEHGRLFLPLYLPYAPTTIGSLGLNVLLLLYVGELIDGRLAGRRRWIVPVLAVLTTVAKPTLSPLLVAVIVGGWALASLRRRPDDGATPTVTAEVDDGVDGAGTTTRRAPRDWASAMWLVVLPTVLVLIPQYYVTATKVQYPGTAYDDRGGWAIHPFQELRDLGALTVYFWIALLFPIVAFVLVRRGLWRDTAVRLAAVGTVIGIVAAILLARTGSVWKGDMLQLPEAAIAAMIVFMPRRLVELRRLGEVSVATFVVLAVVLSPYLVAGTMSWSCHVGLGCPAF
jgi:hypothetical protein